MATQDDDFDGFALLRPPPVFLTRVGPGSGKRVPIYEPRKSGPIPEGVWHGFVFDRAGQFRVKTGLARRHVEFVAGDKIGAAGQLRADGLGRIVEVDCQSRDYPIFVDGPADRMVRYVLEAFNGSRDLLLAPGATFVFDGPNLEQLRIAADGTVRTQVELRIADTPRELDAGPDANSTPFRAQPPRGEEGDGLGKRRAL